MITRRDTIALAAGAASAAAFGFGPAAAQNVAAAELMQAGPLGDVWLGPSDAKATIVEYASLTCPHCAAFHVQTWPEVKKRWIDTGQARFTLREYPIDRVAISGFMIARADNSAKYYPVVDLLFDTQRSWAFAPKPLDAMKQIMRQAGYSQEKFDAILRDQALYDGVNANKKRAEAVLKVDATPTFFINGQRLAGAQSIGEFERILKPIIGT